MSEYRRGKHCPRCGAVIAWEGNTPNCECPQEEEEKEMSDKYILEGRKVVPCPDLLTWAKWFEKADRHVADDIKGQVRVSTLFLGLDQNFGKRPPLLFETMIFGGQYDGDIERYSTWEEAERGHKIMSKKVFGEKEEGEDEPSSRDPHPIPLD